MWEFSTRSTLLKGSLNNRSNSLSMLIGKVIGDVVATRKHPSHEGQKILYVQVLNLDGSARGNPILAVDAVDAGVGDQVLVTQEGWSAMTSVGKPFSPIDMAVIGVIDHVELEQSGRDAVPRVHV